MARLLGCLFEQLGEADVRTRLKAAGWDDAKIDAASDIQIDAAMRGELDTRQVALYRQQLNTLALNELESEFNSLLKGLKTEGKSEAEILKMKKKLAGRWMEGLLTPDYTRGGLNSKPSVDQLRGGYINRAMAAIGDLTHRLRPNTYLPKAMRGQRLTSLNRDIAKYLHGDKTAVDADLAKELDAWLDVADTLRQRANALGADIPFMEGWGLRHTWAPDKVAQTPRSEWIDELVGSGKLDAQRMAGKGNPPLTESQLRIAVGEVYDSITSNGLARRKPSLVDIPGIVAKRHGEDRQLHFTDGEGWFDFAERYGEGLPDDMILRSMYHHIEDLAADIALMERLGPSAAQNLKYMTDVADIAAGGQAGAAVRRAHQAFTSLARQDRSINNWLASAGSSLRSYQVFTKLGGAFLSSITDFGFTAVTAKQYGASMSRIMGNYTQLMAGMSPKELQAMGMTADFLSRTITRTTRYGDKFGAGWMGGLADFTMKASQLERHTLLGQLAFQMEINRVLGSHVGKSIDELPNQWPAFFKHYGITEADWQALGKTRTPEGLLDPTKLEDVSQSARILGSFQQEIRYAFFEPNVRERAMLHQGTTTGTLSGELMRSVAMFKSFPLGIMLLHWGRMAGMQGMSNKLAYGGSLAAITTLLGAMSLTAKELAKGRTPPDFEDPSVWWKAFIQGGTGGLVLDIAAREHLSAQSLTADLAGPAIGDLAGVIVSLQKVAKASAEEGAGAGVDRFTSDVIEQVEKSIPGANLWYMRALISNKAFDMINQHIDPLYEEKQDGLKGWLRQNNQEQLY